jgi:hypothetical protein
VGILRMPPQISNVIHTQGNCCLNLRDAFERMQNGSKLMSKVGQKWNVEGRDILSRINPSPLGGVNIFLISGLRPTTGVYISIFKVDLAGNKRLIELGYEMNITTFNLLFKLQIHSR